MDISPEGNKNSILEKFIDLNPVAIVQYDNNLNIASCNQAFSVLTGISREKLINTKVSDFQIIRMEGEGVQTAIREKREGIARMDVALPSGLKYLKAYNIPVLDENSNVLALFGVYTDVTEEEGEKRRTEQIIKNNPIPFLNLDSALKIRSANQAFCELSGYNQDSLNKMSLSDFKILWMNGDSAKEVLRKKTRVRSESELDFPSGKKILYLYSIPIFDKSGEVDEILITCVDMTAQRRLSSFLIEEIQRLSDNLSKLADGTLTLDLSVGVSDEYTAESADQFKTIQKDLDAARTTIQDVIGEISLLSQAIQMGDLKVKGDPSRFNGAYSEIIKGLNAVITSVEKPVSAAITVSKEYASGNFAISPPELKVEGDFLLLKEALINIGIEVSSVLRGIDKEMEELTQRAEEANAGVKDVAEGSHMVAKNAEEVRDQSEKGKENLAQVLRAMMDLSANVEEVASSTESVSQVTHETNTLSKQGVGLAQNAESGMNQIMLSSGEAERIISEIKDEMQKIGKIVGVITDIASQTNLLALNAAIEAARAGEAGRGFAVVASEVKALALESRSSAENIADMITNLQNKSDKAAVAMEEAETAVEQGNLAVGEVLAIFNRIVTSIDQIARNMDDVSATTEQQAASVEEITASAHEVAALVDEIAKEAVSSAAAAEQSSAGTSQIVTVVEDLNKIILKVSGNIGKFRYT